MKEVQKRDISSLRGLVYVLCGLAVYLILRGLVMYLAQRFDFRYATYVLYVVLALAAVVLMRWCITEFTYRISRTRFTVQRKLGRKDDEVLSIPFERILSLTPYSERSAIDCKLQDVSLRRKGRYVVFYTDGGVKKAAVISCSTEFYEALSKAVSAGEPGTDEEQKNEE